MQGTRSEHGATSRFAHTRSPLLEMEIIMENSLKPSLLPSDRYHFLLWTPGDKEHYNMLSDNKYRTALDEIKRVVDPDMWYVDPSNGNAESELRTHLSSDSNMLVRIVGYSGVGKSTFLRTVLTKNKSEKAGVNFNIIDFRIMGQDSVLYSFWRKWLAMNCANSSAQRKIIFCFLHEIEKLLRIYPTADKYDIKEYRKELNNLLQNHKKLFGTNDEYKELLKIIERFLQNKIMYTSNEYEDSDTYIQNIREKLFNICTNNDSDRETFQSSLINLLKMLFVLQMCNSAIEIILNCSYRFYFAIDNIEHFIDGKIVHAEDIQLFIDTFVAFDDEMTNEDSLFARLMRNILGLRKKEKLPNLSHNISDDIYPVRLFHKIILVLRETTSYSEGRRTRDNIADASWHQIDITEKVKGNEIVLKKVHFYNVDNVKSILYKHNIKLFEDATIKAIETLLNDVTPDGKRQEKSHKKLHGKGVWNRIEELYSFNLRRIMRHLFEAIDEKKDLLEKYIEINNNIKNYSGDSDKGIEKAYKNGSRQIIARLLWNLIINTNGYTNGYIDRLGETNNNFNKHGFAYQITSLLSQNKEDADPMSLSDLIMKMMNRYDKSLDVSYLSSVLFEMYQRDKNNRWAPLIILKFIKSGEFKETVLYATLKEIFECVRNGKTELSEYNNKFGVKITKAGRFFTEASVEWEYFAALSYHMNPIDKKYLKPIFSSVDLFSDSSKDICNDICNNIDRVVDLAKKKIELSVLADKKHIEKHGKTSSNYIYSELYSDGWLYRIENTSNAERVILVTYAERVIVSHIGYLENFRIFVLSQIDTLTKKYNLIHPISKDKVDSTISNITDENDKLILENAKTLYTKIIETLKKYNNIHEDLTCSNEYYDVNSNSYYIGGKTRTPETYNIFLERKHTYLWYRERIEDREKHPLERNHLDD